MVKMILGIVIPQIQKQRKRWFTYKKVIPLKGHLTQKKDPFLIQGKRLIVEEQSNFY